MSRALEIVIAKIFGQYSGPDARRTVTPAGRALVDMSCVAYNGLQRAGVVQWQNVSFPS